MKEEMTMLKYAVSTGTLAALMLVPALAQAPSQPPGSTPQPQQQASPQTDAQPGFLQEQSANEWRGTDLIDASVRGPDDQTIGEIEDVLIDSNGGIKAVVVSVGGFLGIGDKNVAVPFNALDIKRQANDDDIDRIATNFTRDQLENAPAFRFYGDGNGAATAGGSGTDTTTGSGRR
jgi:sporulation protein YlmC with PRC-barrel domain